MFLAEEVTQGTFSRTNIQGCILGDGISVPRVPYELRTNLVIIEDVSSLPDKDSSLHVECRFFSKEGMEQVFLQGSMAKERMIGEIDPDRKTFRLLFIIPIVVSIPDYGKMSIAIIENENRREMTWYIKEGEGSYTGRGAPKKISDVVTSASPFDVDALIGSTLSDIVICDGYLPTDLILFLNKISNKRARIRIVTEEGRSLKKDGSTQRMRIEDEKQNLLAHFPNLEVRFSRNFHDRMTIIDKNDIYFFGHSFKDINAGRVTRYSKILDLEEYNRTLLEFESTWNNAVCW